eukprot:3433197-Pleurochrysis_carterae.AAC.1
MTGSRASGLLPLHTAIPLAIIDIANESYTTVRAEERRWHQAITFSFVTFHTPQLSPGHIGSSCNGNDSGEHRESSNSWDSRHRCQRQHAREGHSNCCRARRANVDL